VDGLMCEYAVLEASQCLPVPDSLSLAEAAMLEPFQVSVHAANLVGMRPGETVAVVGAGAIGLGCLQVARAGGAARVIVTDRLGYRLKIAKRMGADATIHVEKEAPAEAMNRLTDGHGADLVFECTNRAAGVVQAIQVAAIGARVACTGIAEEDTIPVDPHEARRKELSLVFTRRSRGTLRQALALVASGRADIASFVTHRFNLEHAAEGFELMEKYEDGIIKALIEP
jgi:L-iditol 2-dehydrogenase